MAAVLIPMLTITGLLTPVEMVQRVVAAIQLYPVPFLLFKKIMTSALTPVLRTSGVVKPQRVLAVDVMGAVKGYLIFKAP